MSSSGYLVAVLRSPRGRVSIAVIAAMLLSGALLLVGVDAPWRELPMMVAVVFVGVPLLMQVGRDALRRSFGADVLGLLALVVGAVMGEWVVASIIALMLSGGQALEEAASARASEVLAALARRSPAIAHRRQAPPGSSNSPAVIHDIPVAEVRVGDELVLLPHEICPVDATVLEGHGSMDESYLTGEPYVVPKGPGSTVLSGAVNSTTALVVRADKLAVDSRYAQIVGILERAEGQRPPMRRLADRLGAAYTVIAIAVAALGWAISGDPDRFLAVLVIATPCPLLIGVPVAIIGAISLAARNGIIIKDPGMLERISTVRTMIFDKTGTLTYGRPVVTDVVTLPGAGALTRDDVLALTAAVERYSRHPLAAAIIDAAANLPVPNVSEVAEHPGRGLVGVVDGHMVTITGRAALPDALLPGEQAGLECVVVIDGAPAALIRFRDEPRLGAREFIGHLGGSHQVVRTVLLSGDRVSEVEYLAGRVGMDEAHASVSPEEKLRFVREATMQAPTAFLGDGINDAPAMTAATVGIAFGRGSDITAEAASAVVLDSSLERLDELLHIGRRMRRIALQTAIGGIALSVIGMVLAVAGLLPPIAGAIGQEAIDVLAILNAARVALVRGPLGDVPSPDDDGP